MNPKIAMTIVCLALGAAGLVVHKATTWITAAEKEAARKWNLAVYKDDLQSHLTWQKMGVLEQAIENLEKHAGESVRELHAIREPDSKLDVLLFRLQKHRNSAWASEELSYIDNDTEQAIVEVLLMDNLIGKAQATPKMVDHLIFASTANEQRRCMDLAIHDRDELLKDIHAEWDSVKKLTWDDVPVEKRHASTK